jgi:hypothetical protein
MFMRKESLRTIGQWPSMWEKPRIAIPPAVFAIAEWLTRERIGRELKERYQPPKELSPRMIGCWVSRGRRPSAKGQ